MEKTVKKQGLAQSLFIQKEQRRPWELTRNCRTSDEWPIIEQLITKGLVLPIDEALATQILSHRSLDNQPVALAICYLCVAARLGHLCIIIDQNTLSPDIRTLWEEDNLIKIQELDFELLKSLIRQGFTHLPKEIISEVSGSDLIWPSTPLCRMGEHLYLQRNWIYESLFLHHWQRLAKETPTISFEEMKIEKKLQKLVIDNKLLPEQAKAISLAFRRSVSVIAGGPGTGKTYTAGQLIKIFWEEMDSDQREHCEIALAAPTGKAAANLQASLEKAWSGTSSFNKISAKTLHSLLGIRSPSAKFTPANTTISADIILVDESSMIDVRLMAHLFGAIKPGARIILLGDKYQLPPVEAGCLFSDLMSHSQAVIELKHCMRAELRDIIDFAEAIKQGNSEEALHIISSGKSSSGIHRFDFDIRDSVKLGHQKLLKRTNLFFPTDNELIKNPKQLLKAYNQFRILSPMRQGPWGVENINRLFLNRALKDKNATSLLAAPIMIIQNDYRQSLFNGEVGVLVSRVEKEDKSDGSIQMGDYAIFPGTNDEIRIFSAMMLPKYDYAYCLSVHKSQGSEFAHVLLIHPEGGEAFGREILYTAATRAKQRLEILSSEELLSKTIQKQSSRLSGISYRLEHPIKKLIV